MNKPASELIALATIYEVRANANRSCQILADEYATVAQALRTAAHQSSSERAGVDALREALRPFAKMAGAMYVSGHCGGASPEDWPDRWHVTVQGGKHFHTPQQHGGYLTVADFRRAAEALATPPAQPAPAAPHGKPNGAVREVLAELMDRGLLGGVDDDLHQEIGEAVVKAALSPSGESATTETHPRWTCVWCGNVSRSGEEYIAHQRQCTDLAAETSPGDVYREVIDEALIVRHLGVAKGNAKAELNQILDWDVAAALDPAVSGRKA